MHTIRQLRATGIARLGLNGPQFRADLDYPIKSHSTANKYRASKNCHQSKTLLKLLDGCQTVFSFSKFSKSSCSLYVKLISHLWAKRLNWIRLRFCHTTEPNQLHRNCKMAKHEKRRTVSEQIQNGHEQQNTDRNTSGSDSSVWLRRAYLWKESTMERSFCKSPLQAKGVEDKVWHWKKLLTNTCQSQPFKYIKNGSQEIKKQRV